MDEPAASHNAELLRDAFHVFNQLSRQLTDSYQDLEGQVARLKDELAVTHSDRLRALTEQKRLADRLRQLLEALPGGVIVVNGDGRVAEKNGVAAKLLGEPLLDLPWVEIADRCFWPATANPHERRLKNGGFVSISITSNGTQGGQVILLTDVSEMRALQDVLNQQRRLSAMGEMVAAMAHQVRTPLSAAILYASHVANPELGEEHRVRFAHKIQERLRHLERQVNDMLSFARGGRVGMADFPLERLLGKLAESMESCFCRDAFTFKIANQTRLESVTGNEDALLGILMNLLTNAVEATEGQGVISLTVTQPAPGAVRFTVADNGAGVADAHRERIFEPFYTTRSNGTGLGLAVVDAVARMHGGSADCESAPGQGAVFSVTLPLSQHDAPLPGGSCHFPHSERKHTR